MATAGEAVRPRIRPRKIIERPRLTRMLDESKARVRLLIGSAGYGKTTLAEQWSSRPERRAGWVRCRRSAADIAVLSRLVAAAGAAVVPGCQQRLEQRLSVTPDPEREADVLAEILAEDLAEWPSDGWIVIDDYHEAMEAAAAERFVEVITRQSPVQLLIASRFRPSWITSRDLVYQAVLEIGQDALAMVEEEVSEVLDAHDQSSGGLRDIANGWPAVIGLASQCESNDDVSVPATLYDFFAEEIFKELAPALKSALAVFASLPVLTWTIAREILGENSVGICREALRLGLIEERQGDQLELHPLARSFLTKRAREQGIDEVRSMFSRCVAFYVEQRDWDAAFDLVERTGLTGELESLLDIALEDLLNEARLATIENWLKALGGTSKPTASSRVAEAQLALRRGEHLQALTLAENALRLSEPGSAVSYQALLLAGEAAHIGTDELGALEYFVRAGRAADTAHRGREALWGQLMCLSELELPEASSVLEELARTIPRDDAREVIREAGRRLGVEFRFGTFESVQRAAKYHGLVSLVDDPVVRASFRSTYSTALALSAQYGRAKAVAIELIEDAASHRLEFVRPYGLSTLGIALAGLRDFDAAEEVLHEAATIAASTGNSHAEFNAYAIVLRVLLQQGRVDEALRVTQPIGEPPGRGICGEVAATRALAHACRGGVEEARRLLTGVRGTTRSIEARVLVPAVDAVTALWERSRSGASLTEHLLSEAENSGAVDLLVSAYRASPQLAAVLLATESCRERMWRYIALSGDEWLARSVGVMSPTPGDRRALLTRREREVYDLLCQGLTNRQIAECLVISEETVKLHVHHVFDKTGVRSRTALVIEAMRANAQAAPRMDSGSSPSTSDS